ncbi:MAG: type 4a pilus biogenesis protein PilO [Candidatus Omnitrophica bacterium]|nr:type 4a pilus biogenesis protein PilO [Candidatus Omnitrophota bacterium]
MINQFLARLSNRERIVVIAAVVIISAMLLDRIVLGPIVSKIYVLGSTIKDKEKALRMNMRILSNEDRTKKEEEFYKKYSLTALSPEDELASLLGEIETMALSSKVYLIDSSPSGTKEKGIFKIYLIKVDCGGTMNEIFRFLHSMENSRKLMGIESLRVRPTEKDSDIMKCNLIVTKTVLLK